MERAPYLCENEFKLLINYDFRLLLIKATSHFGVTNQTKTQSIYDFFPIFSLFQNYGNIIDFLSFISILFQKVLGTYYGCNLFSGTSKLFVCVFCHIKHRYQLNSSFELVAHRMGRYKSFHLSLFLAFFN